MAYKLDVEYNNSFAYKILIENNFNNLKNEITDNLHNTYARVCIVSDSKVANFYMDELSDLFKSLGYETCSFIFEEGEASKNLDVCQQLYEHLIINHFDRHDLLVALGGGVVGDLTGFCAATYLRGIDFIQVPTSLLAFADSSIGGKTGVDFKAYKNMVGAFHMPKLVYMNTSALKTLDDDQFSCGMAEIIKHGLIRDSSFYYWLTENINLIKGKNDEVLAEMIFKSCTVKRDVVQKDPKEQNIRAYLNFGHTIGHAIEKLADYRLNHGQCVALGMNCALNLSKRDGYVNDDEYNNAINLMQAFDLYTSLKDIPIGLNLKCEDILRISKSDKKMINNKVKFVFLEKIGQAAINTEYTDEDLIYAINTVL